MDEFLDLGDGPDLRVRVTTQVVDFMEVYGSIFKDTRSIVSREMKGTPEQHYHAYVVGIKFDTLRSRLKKYFSGNKQYSCERVKNSVNQKRYVCKGTEFEKPDIICNTLGVDVEECYRMFWSDRRDYEVREKKRSKSQKEFKRLLYERVLQTKGDMEQFQYLSIPNIINCCIDLCKENDKLPPGDYLMIQYIEYVKMMDGDKLNDKIYRIIDKMRPRDGFN